MTIIARILSLASGFALMGYAGPPENLIATSIIINLSLAPLTAIVAMRRTRSPAHSKDVDAFISKSS